MEGLKLTRRSAISALAAGVATLRADGGRLHAGAQTNAWPIANFDELLAVLARMRGFGYEGFETSFRNVQLHFDQPKTARQQLQDSGLRFVNIHIFMDQYDPRTRIAPEDLIARVAKGGAALGAFSLVLSGAPCVAGGKLDAAAIDAKASALNAAGKLCRELGIEAAYHNHGPEFADRGLEIKGLLERTDPKQVHFVIDAGHAFRAGADIPAFVAKHHARLAGMHLRDFHNGEQVILGQGDFHLQPVFEAIRKARWTGWLFNEEERLGGVKLGDSAITPARAEMKKVFGV